MGCLIIYQIFMTLDSGMFNHFSDFYDIRLLLGCLMIYQILMVVVAITFMAHISLRLVFLFHHTLLFGEDKYHDSKRILKQFPLVHRS